MIWWWLFAAIEFAIWGYHIARAYFGFRTLARLDGEYWIRSAQECKLWPSLLAVVPARNEEENLERCLRSLLDSNYPDLRIAAVDDRSTDSTGAIMERLRREHPRGAALDVIHITELPTDVAWLGKTHAMWLGAQHTSSDVILFTDGDIFFHPETLSRAVAYLEAERADHLVLFPTMVLKTFGEAMMISLFQTLFIFDHRAWEVADPKSKQHIGVGAFNMVRRGAYDTIGTYRALRLAVLDDMKLGQRVKLHGLRQRVAYGRGLVEVRWAKGARGVIQGLIKNAFAVADFRTGTLLLQIAGMICILLGPYAGILFAPGLTRLAFLPTIAIIWVMYAGLTRESGISPLYCMTHPVSSALFIYTMLRSMMTAITSGGIEWRGTRYSLAEIRKQISDDI